MKQYPSIPYLGKSECWDEYWYIFDKLDGSNIRAEWSMKKGGKSTWRFAQRKGLIDGSNPFLPEAEGLIREGFCSQLEKVFRENRWQQATAFFEFRGEDSFAGHHQNEDHSVFLLDVAVFKRGLLEPGKLLKMFGHLPMSKLIFRGQMDEDELKAFIEKVHAGEVEGITSEGVVLKSGRFDRTLGHSLMFKAKTQAWRDRLKEFVAGDEYKYKALL